MNRMRIGAIALSFAGAMALGLAGSAAAAPVASGMTGLKAATPSDVSTVQYRRGGYRGGRYHRGRGWGPGAGIAAGIIGLGIGAALAPRYYYDEPPPYYGPPRYYAPPAYYYDGPRYYREPYWD
jgi:hypothetical protein